MSITILFLVCQTEMCEPQNTLKFAEHLYAQGDYAEALHEYRRYLFLDDSVEEGIHDRIIDCLTRLERYHEATNETEHITDINKRNYTKGLIYFAAGVPDSSRTYLSRVDVPYANDARRMIGLGYAYEFKFNEAALYIDLPKKNPSHKEPVLGALLALFPGGGHFYAGRYGDGVYSLLIVSTAALLSYYYHNRDEDVKFGFTLGAAILFYAGNIYGGINAVRNYNYNANNEYLQQILKTD
jgi:hypothetical protein